MKEVKELLGLKNKKISIKSIDEININDRNCKVISVVSTVTKVKCPECNKYTKSVRDKLKPTKTKFVKVAEYECYLSIERKRFICWICNKRIIEDVEIINKGKN